MGRLTPIAVHAHAGEIRDGYGLGPPGVRDGGATPVWPDRPLAGGDIAGTVRGNEV